MATGLPEPEGRREREGDTEPLRVTVAGAEVAAGEREGEPEAQAVGARVVGAGVLLRVRSTVPLADPVAGAVVAAGEREGEPEAQPVGAGVVVIERVGDLLCVGEAMALRDTVCAPLLLLVAMGVLLVCWVPWMLMPKLVALVQVPPWLEDCKAARKVMPKRG